MLIIKDQAHYDKVMDFAESAGLVKELVAQLEWLTKYSYCGLRTRVDLYSDFAPNSFYWTMEAEKKDGTWGRVMNGGLIWHASGQYPDLTVSLESNPGNWSIHT